MFTIDGAFVKTFGAGVIGGGLKDVLCSGPNIFVADNLNCRLCVFSTETCALIRAWGLGQADGQFNRLATLAAHEGKLYVLDLNSRVQVFQ